MKLKFHQRLLNQYYLNKRKVVVINTILSVLKVPHNARSKLTFKILGAEDDSESADDYGASMITIEATGPPESINILRHHLTLRGWGLI